MKFEETHLSKYIVNAIKDIGYETMTPIQEQAIPEILNKKDIIGLAQTGTGKTAAFALPIINRLLNDFKCDKKIKALILTPTRELAIQIRDSILLYTKRTDLKCSVVMGGVNQKSQINVLKKGLDILVATPGRLLDLINQGKVNLSNVEILVLDEADTMLDMGFIKDVKSIISEISSKTRQTLLFSATMPNEIKDLSSNIMINPTTIKIKSEEITADNIEQLLYYVDKCNKFNLLLDLISTKEKQSILIFTRTKHGANNLEKKLKSYDINVNVIHGDKTQSNRVRALKEFKSGINNIMIATDIASRGIDIKDLNLVINFDLPEKAEIYIHRIGRTARAGKNGKAITLCSSAEIYLLKEVEKLINRSIKIMPNDKYPMVLKETNLKKNQSYGKRNNNLKTKNSKNTFKKYKINSTKKTFRRYYKKNNY